ncbi:MAG TPA: hypothetical protein VEP90_25880, partial [Methylomirabilota bacterium]|nr:hypothetical protein [Methylomirabilota bacterium]
DSTIPIALSGNDKKFYNRLSGINKAKMRIKGAIPPNRNIGKVKVKKEEVDEGIAGALLKTGAKLVGATISKGLGITPGTLSYIRNQQNISANIRAQANRSHSAHLAKHVAKLNKQHAKHIAQLNKTQAAKPASKAATKPSPTPSVSTGNPPSHVSRQSFHAALKAAGGNLKHINPAHLQAAAPKPKPAGPVSPTRHRTIQGTPAAKPPQPQSAPKPQQLASKSAYHPVTISAVHKANRARPIVRASMGTTNWKPTKVTMGKPRIKVKQQSFKSEYEHERNDLLQEVMGGWRGFNTSNEIGTMSHEDLLDKFVHHHNKAMKFKKNKDISAARVHFRARNHYMTHYVRSAPDEHFKNLHHDKVKEMLQIHEGFKPIQKIRNMLQKRNTSDKINQKMGRWQISQKQAHQQDKK